MAVPNQQEIKDQISEAEDGAFEGNGSKWPSMTYEQGVVAALRWVVGDDDTPPMSED